MRQTLFFLLMTMAFPSVQAFCDNKPCDTPFLCYERELCRFKENAKSSIALTMRQLTREYQQKLAQTTNALIAKHQAQLSGFEKQQQNALESSEQAQASMAATLKELTAQYQQKLAATNETLIEQAQIRLDAFEQAYRKKMKAAAQKMEAEAELSQLAREAAEKDADQIRAVLEELSVARPWQEAVSKLSNQIAEVEENLSQKVDKPCKAGETVWLSDTVFQDCLADDRLGPKMAMLQSGTFRMGDIQGGLSNAQVHSVSIDSFAMGQYEVTVAEFRQFVNATGYQTDAEKANSSSTWRNPGFFQTYNHPVVYVSWNDATAYTKWLSQQTGHQYRLPTEAQWEYAARAGTETKYWWGNDIGSNNANCHGSSCGDSFQYTAPVGSFAANPFGLFDTAGNVWEWTCSEWQTPYAGKEQQCADSAGRFVLRGGAWNNGATRTRSANRNVNDPTNRNGDCGFRPARIK